MLVRRTAALVAGIATAAGVALAWTSAPAQGAHAATRAHAVAAVGTAATPHRVAPTVATYPYARTDDPQQRLTATWDPARRAAPWVVTIHGGSWVKGRPADVQDAVDLFRAHGFQVFNLAYRLVAGGTQPTGVSGAEQRKDVLTALAWIRAHAADFGIDPGRGALYGSSAGGNLAALAGLAGDGGNGIRAIVSVAGVVQPSRLWDDVHGRNAGERATSSMTRLAGHARTAMACAYPAPNAACRKRWHAFDAASAISAHDPAVLLYQGLADRTVPHQMAEEFRRRLDRADVGGSLTLVPRLGHTQAVALDGGARQAAMLRFVRQRTAVSVPPALSRVSVTRVTRSLTNAVRPVLRVRVAVRGGGSTPSGAVTATVDGRRTTGRLVHGRTDLVLSRLTVGTHAVTVRYRGSPLLQPRSAAVDLHSHRVAPELVVRTRPGTLHAGRTAGRSLVVTTRSAAGRPTGARVTVRSGSRLLGTATVRSGRAVITLPAVAAGRHRWRVSFAGTATVAPARTIYVLTVRR